MYEKFSNIKKKIINFQIINELFDNLCLLNFYVLNYNSYILIIKLKMRYQCFNAY